jgi:hypothetical protein
MREFNEIRLFEIAFVDRPLHPEWKVISVDGVPVGLGGGFVVGRE